MAEPEKRAESEEDTKLARAVGMAKRIADSSVLREDHAYASDSALNDAKVRDYVLDSALEARLKDYALEPDEEIMFVLRQSRLQSLVPKLIIATGKKIAIVQPSPMHLLGIRSMAFRSAEFVQYTKINDVSAKRGTYLHTVFIRIPGSEVLEINGMRPADADLLLRFLLAIVDYLEK